MIDEHGDKCIVSDDYRTCDEYVFGGTTACVMMKICKLTIICDEHVGTRTNIGL
jgi:hypothetical protein